MKVLSLFSGVGGFDLGLENAGMETVFQCEWDKHATSILQRHWPDVPRWGDITTLTGRHILDHAPVIDVVAWGSPCQDLSVAGKRAGLSGQRSGLFHEGIRIIKELRKETNNAYPRISIWENVYGALNSNKGADFGLVLDEMAEAGSMVIEWRVLDAQYFGVPQRRRRVFVVAIFDPRIAANCPDPLLPLRQGVRWNPATSRTARQTTTRPATQSLGSGSDIANTISASLYHHGTVVNQDANNGHVIVDNNFARPIGSAVLGSEIVGALNAVDYKWPQNQQLGDNKFVVQHQRIVGPITTHMSSPRGTETSDSEHLVVEPFVKAKRAQSTTDDETWVEGDINPTINQFDQGDVRATTAIVMRQREGKPGGGKGPLLSEDKSLTLAAAGNDQTLFVEAIPIQDGREIEKHQNGLGVASEGEPSYTLDQTGAQAVAYSFDSLASNSMKSSNPNSGVRETDIAKTLDTARPDPSCNQGGIAIVEPIGIQGNVIGRQDHNGPAGKGHTDEGDPMFTLNTTDHHAVATTMSVRRLTPLECERLMGWPDNWTAGQADTHRYKQCGNGVASPVAQWIGEQILNIPQ